MRDNTDAKIIKNKIPQNIISERSKILHCLSMVKKRKFYEKNIGDIKQVLIENIEDGLAHGHSENYIPVRLMGKRNDVNKIIPVKFIKIEEGEVIGEKQA
jgi:threonylcarbamoyladenosine tRNA methylthiotransferase MtaB